MMFPEYGQNNGYSNFGLGGWGGGILGFLLGAMFANGGFGGFGGWGNSGSGLANQINNDNNADLIMNAINGTDADVRLLATTLNADLGDVNNAIDSVRNAVQQVGAANGMGFLQVTNAIQSGDSALSRQLCEACCENRLLTTQQGYEARIATIEQTNQLGSQADRNTQSIVGAIQNQSTMITREFCELKERELQDKINTLTADNALLRSNAATTEQTAQIAAMINALQNQITEIKSNSGNNN